VTESARAARAAPAFLRKSDFAAHLGVGRSYVSNLATQGRLVMGSGANAHLIDVAATKARLKETTAAPERANEAAQTPLFADAKDQREHYQAQMARLDYEQRVGTLLLADDARALVAGAATGLRARLELLPDQLAPELAATADEQRIRALLANEIEAALAELAHQFGKLGAGQGA
jgi:hypothetical protein